jgi:hypothetical protein
MLLIVSAVVIILIAKRSTPRLTSGRRDHQPALFLLASSAIGIT